MKKLNFAVTNGKKMTAAYASPSNAVSCRECERSNSPLGRYRGIFLTMLLVCFTCMLSMQELNAQTTTKYYFVFGIMLEGNEQCPFVTNVVRLTCKRNSDTMVRNQFSDFYNAFVKRKSGYNYLSDGVSALGFDTYDKAEQRRRELIADYNKDWDTYLIRDFSVMCDDDDD